jgi:hypothetical protein
MERMDTQFTGTILRIEADGFGLVKFDEPIGPHANGVGLISASTQPLSFANSSTFEFRLKAGMRVRGFAEPDDRDVASIKSLAPQTP